MTADEPLVALLRSALPPVGTTNPARDLWPLIAARRQRRASGLWVDLGLTAVVTGALLWQPEWLVQLAYHL
jgi:hypothetical protein